MSARPSEPAVERVPPGPGKKQRRKGHQKEQSELPPIAGDLTLVQDENDDCEIYYEWHAGQATDDTQSQREAAAKLGKRGQCETGPGSQTERVEELHWLLKKRGNLGITVAPDQATGKTHPGNQQPEVSPEPVSAGVEKSAF